jgi:FkbM family methyltransferase
MRSEADSVTPETTRSDALLGAAQLPPARLRVLRAVGSRLPALRGRGAILRLVTRLLRLSLSTPVRLVHEPLGELLVDPSSPGPMRDTFFGVINERRTLAVAARFLRPGDHVVDVGANYGWMTRYFAMLVGSRGSVDAYEPSSRLYDYLTANVALAPSPNISTRRLALGARSEERLLRLPPLGENPSRRLNEGMSTLTTRLPGTPAGEAVQVCRLDDLYPEGAPSLLKIDVEGWEGAVLEGARRLTERLAGGRSLIIVEARLSERDEHSEHLLRELELLRERGMIAFCAGERSLRRGFDPQADANVLLFSPEALEDLSASLPA